MINLPLNTAKTAISSTGCKSAFTLFLLLTFIFAGSGCQDHHWVSYEEMGPVSKMEANPTARARPKPAPAAGKTLVSGKVELAKGVSSNNFAGWSLFIIVRSADDKPMLAAIKAEGVQFPYSFKVTDNNIMFGESTDDTKIIVRARYDSDGNVDTKDPNDLFGKYDGELAVGAENVVIKLAKQKE